MLVMNDRQVALFAREALLRLWLEVQLASFLSLFQETGFFFISESRVDRNSAKEGSWKMSSQCQPLSLR